MNKSKARYFMDDKDNPWGIVFYQGGNPPISAGIFDQDGKRMAWCPAEWEPTQANVARVVRELIWTRENDEPITRAQIRALELKASAP